MTRMIDPAGDMQDLDAGPGACFKCGKDPAEGFASIWTASTGERWYCHGDEDDFSCYEGANSIDPDAFGFVHFLLRPDGGA